MGVRDFSTTGYVGKMWDLVYNQVVLGDKEDICHQQWDALNLLAEGNL